MNRKKKNILTLLFSFIVIVFTVYVYVHSPSSILENSLSPPEEVKIDDENGDSIVDEFSDDISEEYDEYSINKPNSAMMSDSSSNVHEPTYIPSPSESFTPEESRKIEPTIQPNTSPKLSANYLNHEISLLFPSGGKLTLGVETDDCSALYLSPRYDCAADEISAENMHIGYYLSSIYPDYDLHMSSLDIYSIATAPLSESHFYITDRTYDTLVPCSYHSEKDFGISWTDEDNWNGQEPTLEKHIGIRIVDLSEGHMLGIARLSILYDENTNTYSAFSLNNGDAAYTDNMDPNFRWDLINNSLIFFTGKDYEKLTTPNSPSDQDSDEETSFSPIGISAPDGTDWNGITCFVEKTEQVYFPLLYSSTFQPIRSGSVQHLTLYAVTINSPVSAYGTFYFSPKIELAGGQAKEPTEDPVLWGVDLYEPFSRQSVLIRPKDRSFFFGTDN